MSLKILCSARYLKSSGRIFNKITEEYDPPSFWMRLKVKGSKVHHECSAQITDIWTKKGRSVAGVDPINMFWVSEPNSDTFQKEQIQHYKPDIMPQKNEILGLCHIKLLSKYRNPNLPVPSNNTPAENIPEIKLDRAKQENTLASKRLSLPYGIFYIKVVVSDKNGYHTSKIFKFWGSPHPIKCEMRNSWFYERWKIKIKSILPSVRIRNGF